MANGASSAKQKTLLERRKYNGKMVKKGAGIATEQQAQILPFDLTTYSYSIMDNAASLSKEKDIILYCSGEECDESTSAGRVLIKNGFKQGKIRELRSGFSGWQDAGYPIETAGGEGKAAQR